MNIVHMNYCYSMQHMMMTIKSVYKVHSNYGRIFSEWSEIEDRLGTSLQIAGGCMDRWVCYFHEKSLYILVAAPSSMLHPIDSTTFIICKVYSVV